MRTMEFEITTDYERVVRPAYLVIADMTDTRNEVVIWDDAQTVEAAQRCIEWQREDNSDIEELQAELGRLEIVKAIWKD